MKEIVGREKEIKILENIFKSPQAELLAIYGRRRVGKTYLINNFFHNKGIFFECTGIKDGKLKDQLNNFITSYQEKFYPELSLNVPKSWREAFEMLTKKILEFKANKKIIIFFDEMPWLASPKSKFLQEFDYFWNTRWSRMANLKIIVCGSAASWILDNLINAKGGLHNRISKSILLEPFNLNETEKYLLNRKIVLNQDQILEIYTIMGGVPFYLNQIENNKSIAQNINDICFRSDGLLNSEFARLFKSLFEAYEINLKIVKILANYRYGLSLAELSKKAGKSLGGRFSERLDELEAAGFIQKIIPYKKKQRNRVYRIADEYTMFYLNWIEKSIDKIPRGGNYWLKISKDSSWQSWSGYAFEIICYKHISQIISALNLNHIGCLIGSWKYIPPAQSKDQGAQIDLLIERDDNAITLCEIKYSTTPFNIDKSYAQNLMNKIDCFVKNSHTTKQIFVAMITTHGIKKNVWSAEIVNETVVLKDLFKNK